MEDKKIIEVLAKELAKRDYDSLREKVSTMQFEEAFKELNGYNRDGDFENEHFDCNYKSITATICKEHRYRGCYVSPLGIEVWLSDVSSPIANVEFYKYQ